MTTLSLNPEDRNTWKLVFCILIIAVLGFLEFYQSAPHFSHWGWAYPILTTATRFPASQAGLLCLAMSMLLILTQPWQDLQNIGLNRLRALLFAIPFGMGFYFLGAHLISADLNLIKAFAYPHPYAVSGEESLHLILSSFALWIFWKKRTNKQLLIYGIGLSALMVFALNLFAVFGHLFQFPLLISFGEQRTSIAAYLLISTTLLKVTTPYQGLFSTLSSPIRCIRRTSLLGVGTGFVLSGIGMYFLLHFRELIAMHPETSNILFIIFEYTTIVMTIAALTIIFRAIFYFEQTRLMEEKLFDLNVHLEKKVAERTAQLKVANDELMAFSRTVSKGLTNPLRIMLRLNEMVQASSHDRITEEEQDMLNRIRRRGEEANHLIYSLLDLSSSDSLQLKEDTVDLSNLMRSIALQLEEQFPERQVTVKVQPGLAVQGDVHLLAVAMTKLMENAWKFTQFSPQARIEFGEVMQHGETLYFIHDNGVGFNMEKAKNRLFKPFESLHEDPALKGPGIGLATADRIIRRHQGRLYAVSEPGQGTTFYFTLPQAPEPEPKPAESRVPEGNAIVLLERGQAGM